LTLSNEGLALMDLADGPVFFLLGGPDLRITLFRVLLVITHILSQRRRGRREEQKNSFNFAFSASLRCEKARSNRISRICG